MVENTNKKSPQLAIETIFIGSAMADVSEAIMAEDGPVHARHMSSIDDLLLYIEDHFVECAVVDQSLPTESRGLKLVLLAAANRIKHLIVLAPVKSRAEIEAIHGVHQVIRTPAAPKQIIGAVFNYAATIQTKHQGHNQQSGSVEAPDIGKALPAPKEKGASKEANTKQNGILDARFATRFKAVFDKPEGLGSLTIWQRFLPVASYAYKKLAIVILSSLFALFLCYGTIILFFLTSSSWSMPIELSSGHPMVVRAEKDLGEMQVRQNQVKQALQQTISALDSAQLSKRDGQLRVELSRKTVDLERMQQQKYKKQSAHHIQQLKGIVADFRDANGKGRFGRNLAKAYAARTITRQSLENGTLSILQSLHQMVNLENDLALMQIEADKIDNRLSFLASLKQQIDAPQLNSLLPVDSSLVYLARQLIDDRNTVAQADDTIIAKKAERAHLENSLSVVSSSIEILLSSPVGRAITSPVTVAFVPYENADDHKSGAPLYRCTLLVVWCTKVGIAGEIIPGEAQSVHPLFGKPLRGVFVEAILDNNNDAKEELLHAGRPPLFF